MLCILRTVVADFLFSWRSYLIRTLVLTAANYENRCSQFIFIRKMLILVGLFSFLLFVTNRQTIFVFPVFFFNFLQFATRIWHTGNIMIEISETVRAFFLSQESRRHRRGRSFEWSIEQWSVELPVCYLLPVNHRNSLMIFIVSTSVLPLFICFHFMANNWACRKLLSILRFALQNCCL